jgi:carbonic anhydrase
VLHKFKNKTVQVQAHVCEQSAILVSLGNLMSYPWISSRVYENKLALHGWYFDMPHGELYEYCPQSGVFEVLVDNLEGVSCQA